MLLGCFLFLVSSLFVAQYYCRGSRAERGSSQHTRRSEAGATGAAAAAGWLARAARGSSCGVADGAPDEEEKSAAGSK